MKTISSWRRKSTRLSDMCGKINVAFCVLFIALAGSSVCLAAEDTAKYITIGSAPADLYLGENPPFQYDDRGNKISIPAGLKLAIIDTKVLPAMPGPIEWVKVNYEGRTGWVSTQFSLEYQKTRQAYNEAQNESIRKIGMAAKITQDTSEKEILEWFGNPEKIDEPASGVKVFEYKFSREIPEGGCWVTYKLFVTIDKKSSKATAHDMRKAGTVCA